MPHLISRLATVIIVLTLGALSTAASAEVYRCKDEKGQTTLADRPCGAAFSGQHPQSANVGNAADRLAAPNMVGARSRELAGPYDYIAERNARPSSQSSRSHTSK